MSVAIFSDVAALNARAAELFIQIAQSSIRERGRFTVALAGGSTPATLYTLLAQSENAGQIAWDLCFFFFGDERFVSPDDERSNYGMARRTLLTQVPIPPDNIFPTLTDAPSSEIAAQRYAETLAQFFGSEAPPQFDLILLGLGDDGHTASLFPGLPSLRVTEAWTVATPPGVLPPPVDRISFTFPVLNAARCVLFLVTGQKKAEAVQDILENGAPIERRPAAGVQPAPGQLTWLLDFEAAKLLKPAS